MVKNKSVVTLVFTEELLKRVEDYRYKNRIPTRSEAIRILLEKALKEKGKDKSDKQQEKGD